MSSTTIYAAGDSGTLELLGRIRNSYQGAMHIWQALSRKYLGHEVALFGDLEPLWALAEDARLTKDERLAHVSTFDRAYVRREHMLDVASALDAFTPSTAGLAEQARLIRGAFEAGARVVAWQQTSVSQNLWEVPDDDDDGDDDERDPDVEVFYRMFNIDKDTLTGPEVGVFGFSLVTDSSISAGA